MSARYQTLVRLIAWSLLMAFGIGVPFGWASAAGSVIGAALGVLIHGTTRLRFMKWRIPSKVISPVILVALTSVSGLLTAWLPMGLPGVLLINFLLGVLFASVIVPLAMLPGRYLEANPLEAIVAGLVGSLPFVEASGGHFEKPRWFADLVIGGGGNPPHFLAWTGGLLILVAILGTMTFSPEKDGKKPEIKSLAGTLLLLIGTGAIVYFLSSILPPVSSCPVHPPRPPMSFAGAPPPPPPPDPVPLAAAEFSEIPRVSPRLKGIYFRRPDPECGTNAMPSGDRVIKTTIWYLKDNVAPLVTPGESLSMMIPSDFERAHSASWSATRLPGISTRDDFMIHADDDPDDILASLAGMEIRTNQPPVSSPEVSRFLAAMEPILSGQQVPPTNGVLGLLCRGRTIAGSPLSPMVQAVLVSDWVGVNSTLDEKTTNASASVDEFLGRGLKGTDRQISSCAVTMLKAKGIEARLSEGYFIPAEAQPDNRLLITDNDKAVWPEIRMKNGVWIPLPVHVGKISSKEKPPQVDDRKKEIFDALKNRSSARPPATSSSEANSGRYSLRPIILSTMALLASIALVVWFFVTLLIPLRRIVMAETNSRSRVLLHTLAAISLKKYGPREYGESWEHYSEMLIKPVNPLREKILRDCAKRVSFDDCKPLALHSAVRSFLTFSLAGFLPGFLFFHSHHNQTSIPSNT